MSPDPSEAEAREAVDYLFSLLEHSWNSADVESYSRLYSEDAGYVNRYGAMLDGRPEVARIHGEAFAGRFRDTRLRLSTRRFRLLAPTVAIAHAEVITTSDPDDSGELSAMATVVLAKTETEWRIAALHVSDIQPEA